MLKYFNLIIRTSSVDSSAQARCGLFALITLMPVVGLAQNGATPDYISSMSTFEVRSLDGQYAPANGNQTIESVTPAEWLNNDPSNLGVRGVLAAWSGGAKAVSGTKLFVHGGGHYDSANNGMYIFDYAGQANPTGWESPTVISDVSDVRSEALEYADGKPNSVHTYDGVVYASHNNHIYRFGGSRYGSGRFTQTSFKYNVATGEWTRLANYPDGESGMRTIYDPVTGKIFVTTTNSSTGFFFRTDDETWSSGKGFSGSFPWDTMAAWDPSRNRAIMVGEGITRIVNVDFVAETVSVESFNASGNTELYSRSGISAVYDPIRDVYWLFGGGVSSPGYSSIYELRASGNPWTTTRHSLSGDAIPRAKDLVGSWGRFVLMPQWGAIGLVASHDSPAFVIKLPDSQFKAPRPPDNLQAN